MSKKGTVVYSENGVTLTALPAYNRKFLTLSVGKRPSKALSYEFVCDRLKDSENMDLDDWNWDLDSVEGTASAVAGSRNMKNRPTNQLVRKIPKDSCLPIAVNPTEYYKKQNHQT